MRKVIAYLALAAMPIWAEPVWTVDYPKFPVIAPAESWLEMQVRGPASARPQVMGPNGSWKLEEVKPGLYRGRFQPLQGDLHIEKQVLGSCESLSAPLGVFEVHPAGAVFRTGPSSDFDRLTPLAPGVRFNVQQRQGEYVQVSPPLGWVKLSEGKLLPPGTSLGQPTLAQVWVKEPAQQVRLRLGSPCAWQISPDPEQKKLWIDLPGVATAMHEIAYAQKARALPWVRLHPYEGGTRVEIPLRQRYWGYSTNWTGQDLVLQLSPPPKINPKTPLKGLKITLDAGHGGSDLGTVGLELKVKEKDLNLAVTRALKSELEKAGARVIMTRTRDQELTPEGASATDELQARVDVAERSGSQLFLSIHHNARADVRQGRVSHGTHIYYYHPQSRGLAQAIAKPLAQAISESSWMHVWRSFHVTRQTRMPAVLVEVNFLSNPELEKGMLHHRDFPIRAARGIRRGVEQFLQGDL